VDHVDGERTGTGGRKLYWQAWLPAGAPRAVVVVAHGGNEHGGRYTNLAERLTGAGYAVYAQDHRGHGRSEGARGMIERMDLVVGDLDDFVVLAAGKHPDVPLFLLAHSMGGCIGLVYASRHQDRLRGLVLSSPVADVGETPAALRLAAKVLTVVAPKLGVIEVPAGGISRDPEEVRRYDEDPLVHRGKLPVRTAQELSIAIGDMERIAGAIAVPTLLFHGTADIVVPSTGTDRLEPLLGASDLTVRRYEGGYHELFNEPREVRDEVLGDVQAWLDARV
jgi:acylglycerol lipase